MQPTNIETPQREHAADRTTSTRLAILRRANWRKALPYIYLGIALPTAVLLCFLIPPMQTFDEGRHFLRACQIAQGKILSEIEPNTRRAGGWLAAAAPDFVRDKMTPEYFRKEDYLHTVRERLGALDQAAQNQPPLPEKKFAAFAGATIYPPLLYLPQAAAIAVVRLFSSKVYIWFYSARLLNATAAVLLIFLALHLAPAYQLALMIPATLPMSVYQISSVSTDGVIVALSVLFVALCVRFLESDGALLRGAPIVCLLLLTTAKPVYLPFALLLMIAYKRLGWPRSILFCSAAGVIAAGAYIAWSYFVQPFIPLAGGDYAGNDPSAQVHFIATHPIGLFSVLLHTLKSDAYRLLIETIGWFGPAELGLPPWFYKIAYGVFAALLCLILLNRKPNDISRFLLGGLTVVSTLAAIAVAGFVLWTPVGANRVISLQGRYVLPVLAILMLFIPSLNRLGDASKSALAALVFGFFVLSTITTVQTVRHCFFPQTAVLGRNIYELYIETPRQSCPAALSMEQNGWFSSGLSGRADVSSDFRVLVTNESGTILAESDPFLAGADPPYNLLPGSSRSNWRLHLWRPNRFATLRYWLVIGKGACTFGPDLKLTPHNIPEA